MNDFDRVLQNSTDWNPSVSLTFAKNITLSTNVARTMELYRGIDFHKTSWSVSSTVNTSRKVLLSASVSNGDEIRFIANPFLGRLTDYSLTATFRPYSRLQSVLKLDGNRFTDPVNHAQEFHVKIMRSTTTYQFSPRLLVRNITELNAGPGSNHTLFENVLLTYRVNSGTVFYLGYDDRYRDGTAVNSQIFSDPTYLRTNRAVFTKIQYLFRTGGASWSYLAVTATRDVLDPATGEIIARVPDATAADVDRAVSAARLAFDSGDWKRATPQERGQALFKLAALVRARSKELAELETRNSGKPITEAELDIVDVAGCFEYTAGSQRKSTATWFPFQTMRWRWRCGNRSGWRPRSCRGIFLS